MAEAICLRCGTPKDTPSKACQRCGLDPRGDRSDLTKSVYLSTGRFAGDPDRADAYRRELDGFSQRIEQGDVVEFEASELERLRQQAALIERIPPKAVWGVVLRLFVPALGLLLILLVVLLLLRMK